MIADVSVSMIAEKVRAARVARGYSQQTLANLAGLSMSSLTRIEQGLRPDPQLSTIAKIAKALGVTIDALV